jgi:hypothetical protein
MARSTGAMPRETTDTLAGLRSPRASRAAAPAAAAAGDSRADRRRSLAVAWRALWVSRVLVWAAGIAGVLALDRVRGWQGFDPARLTAPFGPLGDILVAPAARWDSVWYLAIAADGYASEAGRAAFFPLYPLLVRAVGAPAALVVPDRAVHVVAGVVVSLAALLAGLYLVHRLASLELGEAAAGLATALVAFSPTAFFFSAVYSESLFLALSVGTLYAGRLGRWRWAAVLGALAAATRSTGVLLVVPLALLYLYGPRADRPRPSAGGAGAAHRAAWRRIAGRARPRHRPGLDAAWLVLVPAGMGAYLAYLQATGAGWLAPFRAGERWYREFAGPLGGVWDGAVAAAAGVRQLASGSRVPAYFEPAGGDPFFVAAHNLGDFAFLVFAVVALAGVLRRLPLAYGAWVACALAVALSYPVAPEPLASLPRYLAVLFPLHMWLAVWAVEHRAARPVLAASAAGLAALTAPFAAWVWVA